MEKKLLKRIGYTFTLIGVLIIVLCAISIYLDKRKKIFQNLDEIYTQVESNYQETLRSYEQKLELYKKDYLNRAYATDFILEHNADLRNQEGLNKIKAMMGVDAIHIVDHSGEIIVSSEEIAQRLNLFEHEEAQAFWGLIKGSDESDFIIDMNATSIVDYKPRDFIGVSSVIQGYAMVEIAINDSIHNQFEAKSAIQEILKYMPTTYEKAVFAIDLETGKIIAKTKNNEQTLDLKNNSTDEERLQILKSAGEGKVLRINGGLKFVRSKQVGDILIVIFEAASGIMNTLYAQVFLLLIVIVAILLVALVWLKVYFSKYVFNDLKHIETNIKQIVTGNMNVLFQTENNEYQSVIKLLNDWKDSYTYKTKRMSTIIGSIGSNIAVFECLYTIATNFYSENIQSILGIDDTSWKIVSKTPECFEVYIEQLVQSKDSEGKICVNERYLEINSYKLKHDFFGVIIDRTEEIRKNQNMINSLREAKEAAQKDNLTNLLNRTGFENSVNQDLKKEPVQGIMMIYDLDNFKQINDNLGHPEGDKVLKLIGKFLSIEFREKDLVGRLGGDEFVVFIHQDIPIEELTIRLEKILCGVREQLTYYYEEYDVSMSIGVTYVTCRKSTYKDLYRYADAALYTAKKLGKDRFYINENTTHCENNEYKECTESCKKKYNDNKNTKI